MKKIAFILITIPFTLFVCGQSNGRKLPQLNSDDHTSDTILKSHYCLSQSDAEKILGQPVKLIESSSEVKDNVIRYRCTYTLTNKESKPNVTCNLYYLIEHYDDTTFAKKAYADIVLNNTDMPGQRKINNLGNEAFLHTDGKNFDMIMLRKNDKILRIKVNKITSSTSLNELQKVTEKIALTL